ncbi:MAG: hypothetical protein COC12_12055 [Rhodobacteraceae bacterium]|nr:MAG: hypothetical protein COC12_12055 [Paracoccaceae bacterium]
MAAKVQDIKRGERLREERERLKLTLVAMSSFGKVSRGSQILYEKGSPPTADYLGKIAAKGADVMYILTGVKEADALARVVAETTGAAIKEAIEGASGIPAAQATMGDARKVEADLVKAGIIATQKYLASLRGDQTEVGPTEIDSTEISMIPRYEAQLAAGNGMINMSEEPVELLTFPSTWLSRLDVAAKDACLLAVIGSSMEPTLYDGDLVLINQSRRTIRNGRIYAFNDIDGTSRIKRLDVIRGAAITIRSDANPLLVEQRLGEEMNVVSGGIIGEVVWAAHTLTDGN